MVTMLDPRYAAGVSPLDEILHSRFGLESFRPWQREAIDELLDGRRRVLVVAPTGGGKSLCYQLPALVLEGTTVVISPLIALMEDQVQSLERRGIAATYLASTLPPEERRARERALAEHRYQLVYVAPERLASEWAVAQLARLAPPLVAVDEAHCISQWGHDFRPDYLLIDRVLDALSVPRVLACTATATPAVRAEIMERLGFDAHNAAVVLRGFARPNLHLAALELETFADRRKAVLTELRRSLGTPGAPRGAAIVYAGTRKHTDRLAALVAEHGWRAAAYHAGLEASTRDRVSREFAQRDLEVIVATSAFGMGIDRPDIRAVVHLQAPGSIEQYYQEVGRAGRDGEPAAGLLLSGSSDFGLRRRLIELHDSGPLQETSTRDTARQWEQFLDLMRYVEAGSCRHDYILRYFGDEQETLDGCGHCDSCERLGVAGAQPEGDPDQASICVRQALAAVARNRGRAGIGAVVGMLHGDVTERLSHLGLTRLSTHGLMADRHVGWITALMRRLITAGLIDVSAGQFPVPRLTARGIATVKSELPVRVLLPPDDMGARRAWARPSHDDRGTPSSSRPKRSKGVRAAERGAQEPLEPSALSDADAELYEKLRGARLEAARRLHVPPYVVCPNRTLAEVAALRPRTRVELATVHGMGPARLDAWGEMLLEVVATANCSPPPAPMA